MISITLMDDKKKKGVNITVSNIYHTTRENSSNSKNCSLEIVFSSDDEVKIKKSIITCLPFDNSEVLKIKREKFFKILNTLKKFIFNNNEDEHVYYEFEDTNGCKKNNWGGFSQRIIYST